IFVRIAARRLDIDERNRALHPGGGRIDLGRAPHGAHFDEVSDAWVVAPRRETAARIDNAHRAGPYYSLAPRGPAVLDVEGATVAGVEGAAEGAALVAGSAEDFPGAGAGVSPASSTSSLTHPSGSLKKRSFASRPLMTMKGVPVRPRLSACFVS